MGGATFAGKGVLFEETQFDSAVSFKEVIFYRKAYFNNAKFLNFVDFQKAVFRDSVFFLNTEFDSTNFRDAKIYGYLILGSNKMQKLDLTRADFLSNSKIILSDLVELEIQPEAIKHIYFSEEIDYNLKRLITDKLKKTSFKENKKAKFELEYIFTKSTMYQDKGDEKKSNKWYQVWKYPKWFLNTLYYLTMGLGYRPFWIIYWILGFIIVFSLFYFKKFPDEIAEYIKKNYEIEKIKSKSKTEKTRFENLINCIYFSAMVLMTFRLKGNILNFFNSKQKKWIISEWIIGFLIYAAFLTLSKSGSILHTLKSLFVG